MQIITAKLETSNFEFVAYSDSNVNANKLLKKAFVDHIKNTGGSLTWAEVLEDVWYEEIVLDTVTVR